MLRGLKITFLLHMFVALAFGLVMFLSPEWWGRIANYAPIDPTVTRVLGAAVLALALSSWLGFRAQHWEDVRIVVETEMAYTVLGSAAMLYSLFFAGAAPFTWVPLVTFVAFGVAWIYFYWKLHGVAAAPYGGSTGAPMGTAAH